MARSSMTWAAGETPASTGMHSRLAAAWMLAVPRRKPRWLSAVSHASTRRTRSVAASRPSTTRSSSVAAALLSQPGKVAYS